MKEMVNKIHHTGITVKSLEESVDFYETVFGLKKVGECYLVVDQEGGMKGVEIRIAFLKAGDDELELLQYVKPEVSEKVDLHPWYPGMQHLSFKVNDIQGFYEMYRDSIEFLTPPVHYRSEGIDTTWAYFRDPNGTILELSEDHIERGYKR